MKEMQISKPLLIGGSAGSVPVVIRLIEAFPSNLKAPVIIVIHRQRNVESQMASILSKANDRTRIIEPCDKEQILPGNIYLAPQNYHLLIESDKTFSLDYSESVQYSRPSIDVTFESAAKVFKEDLIGILLSGASNDGAAGVQSILQYGGIAIVQDPATAEYPAMPLAAIKVSKDAQVLTPVAIISFIKTLATK